MGSGATVAEKLIQLVDETGIDGFNLTRTVAPESHLDFIRFVIPELQQRGSYKTEYKQGSFRHKLFQQGDRLSIVHPVQQFRCQNSASTANTDLKQNNQHKFILRCNMAQTAKTKFSIIGVIIAAVIIGLVVWNQQKIWFE